MRPKQYKIPPNEYRTLLKQLELIEIRLVKSNCVLNNKDGKIQPVDIQEKTQISPLGSDKVQILHTYNLSAKFENSDDFFIKISATYEITFICTFNDNKDFFDIYKQVSLPLNTFPFFREFVFNTTGRMNIRPLTLPLVIL